MSTLWKSRIQYATSIDHHYQGTIEHILPYERLYDTLSPNSLDELLRDAKRLHWQALDLRQCGLRTLPETLFNLPDLKFLSLSNQLSVDDSISNRNTFSYIPDTIDLLVNLEFLDLGGTHITALPDSISKLTNLRALNLSGTLISCLPTSCGMMINLTYLDISDTHIATLPDTIGNLKNLRQLNISDNLITALPESMGRLENLRQLDLSESLISMLPASIKKSHRLQIHSHNEHANKRFFNESKMIIVGQGGVGKSSLLRRLLYNEFSDNDSTEGIYICRWVFSKDNEDYTLNVWDFGGQEIYHATHQFFLTRRSLYILVWDALAEDEYGRVEYWLRTIQSLGGDSPIVIVVNKCDNNVGRFQRIDSVILDRYPQVVKLFYVSCRDNVNIDELREFLMNFSVTLPLMKTVWLDKWLYVRRALDEMRQRYLFISYEEYLSLCMSRDIGEDEAFSLINYLHDLGVVFYYSNDPLLRNLVILSPEWGTDAVYKVLDQQERVLKGRNGILYYSDLPAIWTDTWYYPPRLYPHLLNLMENFQLAFRLDDGTNQNSRAMLIAELLSANPIYLPWTDQDGLKFRYSYDFMPSGIMTRLIVSIHEYLEKSDGKLLCWRRGAYVVYQSARGKIEIYDSIDKRYLDISIIGESSRERQELLIILREKIKLINNRFQKISITELVPCRCSPNCNYFFRYQTLLKAERMGLNGIQCQETLNMVPVSLLLDGIPPSGQDKMDVENILKTVMDINQSVLDEFTIWNFMKKITKILIPGLRSDDKIEAEDAKKWVKYQLTTEFATLLPLSIVLLIIIVCLADPDVRNSLQELLLSLFNALTS